MEATRLAAERAHLCNTRLCVTEQRDTDNDISV